MVVTEERDLKMHKDLLMKVIKDQAGTLEKGILEGVMNLIEAKATRGEIGFVKEGDNAVLTITDDGTGIIGKDELIRHFEYFGTPHDESENKLWAKFRMGRGQLFAFGKNTWRTATFKMVVDIDKWGLKYKLTENLPFVNGCDITIELYKNPINCYGYPSVDRFKEAVRELVEFVGDPIVEEGKRGRKPKPTLIYFNGEQINTPPSTLSWDFQDENAYYLFNAGEKLKYYNLGAYVMSKSTWQTGVSGVIVSKKQLDVNFARNDVKSSCPIYQQIGEVVKQNRINESKKSKKYTAMSPSKRHALLLDLKDAVQRWEDLKGKRILRTAQGKWITMNMFFENNIRWTFAPEGSRVADSVIEQGQAICFSENILHQLNYKGKKAQFFSWLLKEQLRINETKQDWQQKVFYGEREEIEKKLIQKIKTYIAYDPSELKAEGGSKCLMDGFSNEYNILPTNKLTIVEKRILAVLESYDCWDKRVLTIGTNNECASAWTDGESRITLDRKYLNDIDLSWKYSIHKLFATLCHELAHDCNTEGTHNHTPEFDAHFRSIIESNSSPFANCIDFIDKMRRAQMERKKRRIIAKQKAAEEEVKKKLGMAAKT